MVTSENSSESSQDQAPSFVNRDIRITSLLNQTADNNRNRSQDSFASNSTLPPSYVSHPRGGVPRNERHSPPMNVPSSPPSYASSIGSDRHERVSGWRSGISSTSSMSDPGTLADDTESSFADTDVLPPSEGRGTSSLDLQYVYYRVYNDDGPIRSLHPLNPDDPSLSRTRARSVPPPHTAASLKRHLCRLECVISSSTLLTTPSSFPMGDRDRISFLTEACPGLTTQSPIAFLVQTTNTGRNILETANTINSSTEGTETPYLYYRMYAEDGPVRSIQPLNADDPSLSRICARSVPYTIASLKRRLCKVENITGDTNIYATPSSPTAMNDEKWILPHTDTCLGLTTQEPMAFVVKCSDSKRITSPTANTADYSTVDTQFPETRYVYYLLYTLGGDIPSKQPVDPNNPPLGRIRVDSVPPPRNVASMRSAIFRVEKCIPSWSAHLFVNMFSESPMDEIHDPNLAGDFPFSLDHPLAVVLQIHILNATMSRHHLEKSGFLNITKGEAYYTNGVVLRRPYDFGHYGNEHPVDVYHATNPAGVVGFVPTNLVENIYTAF